MPRSTQVGSTSSSSRRNVRGVAAAALARLVEDVHRQLGQPVAGQHVDGTALDHLARGGEPVAEEAAAVGDPEQAGRTGAGAHAGSTTTRRSFTSTCCPGTQCDRGHGPGAVGPQGVLHLHRLEHDQAVALGHRVAHRDEHLGDGTRQRRAALPGHAAALVGIVLGAQGERRLALGPVHVGPVRRVPHPVAPAQPVLGREVDHAVRPRRAPLPTVVPRRRRRAPVRGSSRPRRHAPPSSRRRRSAGPRAGGARRCASPPPAPGPGWRPPAPRGGRRPPRRACRRRTSSGSAASRRSGRRSR